MNTNYKDRKTIFGKDKEAFDEFLAGKERWNAYVKKHGDDTEVDFSGVDFSKHRKGKGEFNFSGYLFPKKGNVNFKGVKFGGGDVYFSRCVFGDELVCFSSCLFGKGIVSFKGADFGKAALCFNGNTFTDTGAVIFESAKFSDNFMSFERNKFSGLICFKKAVFGYRHVALSNSGKGVLTFKRSTFIDGELDFTGAEFKQDPNNKELKGKTTDDILKDPEVKKAINVLEENPHKITDPKAIAILNIKRQYSVKFNYCEFNDHVKFNRLTNPGSISVFSLRHSSFDKSLDISDNEFNCIPDLTNTKLTNQVSLDGVKVNHPDTYKDGDGERLCRLKKIAEDNKNYQQVLDFHVMEMRAKRRECKNIFIKALDSTFDICSTYGQSICRPVLWLCGITGLSVWFYSCKSISADSTSEGFLYALSNGMLPILSAGRTSSTSSLCALFQDKVPTEVYFVSLAQGGYRLSFYF